MLEAKQNDSMRAQHEKPIIGEKVLLRVLSDISVSPRLNDGEGEAIAVNKTLALRVARLVGMLPKC